MGDDVNISSLFKDVDENDPLWAPAKPQPQRRQRLAETFARIPHDKARALYPQLGRAAWALLIELDRLILLGRGQNPVKLTSEALRGSGLTRRQIEWGLRQLERARVITVERKRGRCPLVAHRWHPLRA